jgi:20S proteasome subunit beta 4
MSAAQLADFVQSTVRRLEFQYRIEELSSRAAANVTRKEILRAMPARPYNVDLLVGGYDTVNDKPVLYGIHHRGCMHPLPYACYRLAQYVLRACMHAYLLWLC